ncbi:MAG TPA: exo-beta-N-acetylmuramidase NamZ domain-containing protein [Tepidisphaeraceae bacterium]|jgi:uncharacterized protein YbbC (DUF1343 family)/CubicO group peptidase (beta-lactamase class C family)|nr:exo-beta-N-acetylmuramidase NamZ domain-containing protein [Tepidisphaeraceae bacterium]
MLVITRPLLLISAIVLAMGMPASAQTISAESVAAANSYFNAGAMTRADRLIDQAIAAGKCPGAVLLVGRGDTVLYEKAYGNRALRPTTQPMTTDTIFDLASLTKPLATATSIMILSERGKLALGDPIAKYLPAFAQNGKASITVADLLLHVGGLIPDDDLSDYANGPAIAMQKILALAPAQKPRTRFAYSDVGYIVLGELIRQIDGRSLDKFAGDEIFRPLGMTDTGYLPSDDEKPRCAPTEKRNGRWMTGQVHDPRAYALGGVAGHAGLFSTAEDLARFCRMILAGGKNADHGVRQFTFGRSRILNESTVAEMIQPRPVPGPTGGFRAYGFDVDTAYSSPRGDRYQSGSTLGHTGFTGTALWIDPIHDNYYILLTNTVHPDGKTSVKTLRHDVATVVAEALLGPPLNPIASHAQPTTAPSSAPSTNPTSAQRSAAVIPICHATLTGVDMLERENFRRLAGRKIGLITNQTGIDREGNRDIDVFVAAKNVQLVKLFSPEHGIAGVLDEKIANSSDSKTGLKIVSLYGGAKSQKPSAESLDGIDTLVFDVQDVGVRFYTYISTMGLCMQACAERKIRFVVLDRPNPNTGLVCDGPLADESHLGFTAFGALPLVHGMTVGELALFFNVEFKINCDLQIIAMENWRRDMWWDETGLRWINPSPNLRNPTAALLYPAIGLLEAANVSVGRGTDQPFEQFGAPWIDGPALAAALNDAKLAGLRFVPIVFEPGSGKFAKEKCQGVYVNAVDRNAFAPAKAGLAIAWRLGNLFGDKFQSFRVEKMLQNTAAASDLFASPKAPSGPFAWEPQITAFRLQRQKYLLYQ